MEHPLHYNPAIGNYQVGPSESERKGAIIQDINTIQISLGKEPVGPSQFEELMRCSLGKLQEFINDQAELLRRTKQNIY